MPAVIKQQRTPGKAELNRILAITVPLIVKLAERKIGVDELIRVAPGTIIEFSKGSDEQLELMVNNQTIALGVAVKVGEKFGIKISQIGDVQELIESLGRQSRHH